MNLRPFVLATVAATTSILLAPLSSASAAGVAPVGSTLTATAWERGNLDSFSYDSPNGGVPDTVIPRDGFEEYVYRIYDGSMNADVQGTVGYDSLTEAEQYEWYSDAGYSTPGTPYAFTWVAFACLAESNIESTEILTPEDTTLTDLHYVAADLEFPDAGRLYINDYLGSFQQSLIDGTAFGVDDFEPNYMSITGYPGLMVYAGGGTLEMGNALAFSASYPEFECGGDSQLWRFRILNSADTSDRATVRDLEVTETLHVSVLGEARELESDGVFIGVTGNPVEPFEYNAALWGMTEIDREPLASSEPLASTGADVSSITVLTGVFALLAALAVAMRISRRRATN